MKKLIFFVLSISFTVFSQEDDSYNLDYNNSQNAAELCTQIKASGFLSNAEADDALGKILSVVGASKRFIVAPCEDINNALAVVDDGMRYILYDPEFINSISQTSDYWANMSILAHEVGHHINGHTLSASISSYENKIQELEADEFSGFVMQKIGATLDQATDAIASIAPSGDDTYSSHPNKQRRINAIKKGYERAENNSFVTEKKLTDWEEFYFRAVEKDKAEDYEGAIKDYTESIKLKPDFNTYYRRGVAKENINDGSGAKSDFIRSIEINPKNWESHYRLGRNLYISGDHFGAISALIKYFDLVDYSGDYYDIWAGYYIARSFYMESIYNKSYSYIDYILTRTDFISVIDSEFHELFYILRGQNYLELENFELAKKDFEKASELDIQNALCIELLGDVYAKEENYEKAIEFYNQALVLDPDKYSIYEYRAYAYEAIEDYFNALLDMNEAIKHNPDYGHLFYKRGEYSFKIGDKKSACSDWIIGNEKGNQESYDKLIENCGYSKEDFYSAKDFLDASELELDKENYIEARRLLDKSREMGYEDIYYLETVLYSIYARSEQQELALEVLNKIEGDTKENNIIWWNSQFIYTNFNLKNWSQLVKKVEELIDRFKLDPDALDYSLDIDFINENSDFVYDLYDYGGIAQYSLGNFNESLNLCNKFLKTGNAIESGQMIRVAYLRLADIKNKLGQYLEALQDVNEYIKRRKDWSVGYKVRGEIKLNLGGDNNKYACEDFNLALEVFLKNENEDVKIQHEIQKLIDDNCK
ncbi:tetratricopeptide repeat protein [Flavobacteriaceae bacterium]|nr:tetratricopeptide repeat protein [Flavobacteriaceae bacterium]